MKSYYYKKTSSINYRKKLRFASLFVALFGTLLVTYIFFPLISWEIYFAPVFASSNIQAPIPKTTIMTPSMLQSLLAQAAPGGVDYTNAENWFPTAKAETTTPNLTTYTLSIPKISVDNAKVSTVDYDLASHLVHYGGTALPSQKGNAVIFGHSTLPQLFNPTDYKTIFAHAFKLQVGDEVFVTANNVSYRYKIFSIIIVDPTDTSVLAQNYDDSYLTIITCTPPGTTWKRLVIKSRLEKI